MNAMTQYQSATAMQALVPTSIQDAIALSDTMAKASLVPEHLRNKPGDCLLVVMQAQRWGMDALSVAQCTSVVRGKLCYEGKLVAAVLYSMGAVEGRLRYELTGSGQDRTVRVTGRPRGGDQDETVEGSVRAWATDNGNWKKDPDSMLVYRGTRQWARRYAPEALLGVYTPDELEDGESTPLTATVVSMPQPKPSMPQPKPTIEPDVVEGEIIEKAESGEGAMTIDLPPGPLKLLRAKAAAAGFDNSEESLLQRFGAISMGNLNAVLAKLAEGAQ